MSLAQEMRKIAVEYHEIIDEHFLNRANDSIKTSAENGKFILELDVIDINRSTINKLMSTLRENGFKVELDVLQDSVTIQW
ncbi:hypothetical protein vBPmiSPMCJR_011 [Proteus phage vB_PmiS_PM-CJR]|nr:hypothetical protein vBPmiSPMCJR_011 [Proteus phage vB_PmiS_PM-CJR]